MTRIREEEEDPSLWCVIDALQQDAAAVTTVLLQNARGQLPPAKRVQLSYVRLQQQLQSICCDRRDGRNFVSLLPRRCLRWRTTYGGHYTVMFHN